MPLLWKFSQGKKGQTLDQIRSVTFFVQDEAEQYFFGLIREANSGKDDLEQFKLSKSGMEQTAVRASDGAWMILSAERIRFKK